MRRLTLEIGLTIHFLDILHILEVGLYHLTNNQMAESGDVWIRKMKEIEKTSHKAYSSLVCFALSLTIKILKRPLMTSSSIFDSLVSSPKIAKYEETFEEKPVSIIVCYLYQLEQDDKERTTEPNNNQSQTPEKKDYFTQTKPITKASQECQKSATFADGVRHMKQIIV